MTTLFDLQTPALVLDRSKLDRNLECMRDRVTRLGATLRPHVKTAKSIDVIQRAGTDAGITVSTLREADYFFENGVTDMVYAVGIAPNKLRHVTGLIERGAALTVLLDNVAVVSEVARAAAECGVRVPVLIEVDVDGHRAGVAPHSAQLIDIGRAIVSSSHLALRGVLTHAGGSYSCNGVQELEAFAEQERAGAVEAATRLRAAGLPAPVVSIGSTPTASFVRMLEGVTEVRVGVYMMQDLVMAGLQVCAIDDIALCVLVCVIGHRSDNGGLITDGGWMALSRDLGTARQAQDYGYGLVVDAAGRRLSPELIVKSANQEHGIVVRRDGGPLDPRQYPVGSLLRVLPNHACATGAQHSLYHVVEGDNPTVVAMWPRLSGC